MTDEEILTMLKQAEIVGKNHTGTGDYMDKFITFARLVQQKQREIDAERLEAIDGEWITKTAASALIRSQK